MQECVVIIDDDNKVERTIDVRTDHFGFWPLSNFQIFTSRLPEALLAIVNSSFAKPGAIEPDIREADAPVNCVEYRFTTCSSILPLSLLQDYLSFPCRY